MSVLDDRDALASGDPSGAIDAVCGLGAQVADAAGAVDAIDHWPAGAWRSALVCGMGGSGVGGDGAAAYARLSGRVPVVVHRSYGAPSFTGPDVFVVASSYSGSTEETVDAFRACRAAGASGAAVAGGDPLAGEAAVASWPVVRPPGGMMPRYALGWMAGATFAVLSRSGVIALPAGWATDVRTLLDERATAWGPGAPTSDNIAKALAHELVGAFPVVWGGPGVSGPAALRWKTDLNENAKTFAHSAELPEADHHEIVAFAAEGRQGRPAVKRVLVCLREPGEDARVKRRFEVTAREVAGDFDLVVSYQATAADPAGRFFEFAMLSGLVSCYLGILRGVDPAPIPSIARLKEALSQS